VRDAGRIARASAVGIELDPAILTPLAARLHHDAAKVGADALDWVLGGGEDHGLLATFPAAAVLPEGFQRLGTVHDGGGVTYGGEAPRTAGWDHFAG
jgi:thiamine-monophosphate kinase